MNALMKKIGMPTNSVKFHQIRYVFGRRIYAKTGNLQLTSWLMRHESKETTEKIYLKRSPTEIEEMLTTRRKQVKRVLP